MKAYRNKNYRNKNYRKQSSAAASGEGYLKAAQRKELQPWGAALQSEDNFYEGEQLQECNVGTGGLICAITLQFCLTPRYSLLKKKNLLFWVIPQWCFPTSAVPLMSKQGILFSSQL